MPLEVATNLEELDQTWPLNGGPLGQGAAHIRQIKRVLKTVYPGALGNGYNTPILATEAETDYAIGITSNVQPQIDAIALGAMLVSGVVMYSGLFSAIPVNYQLCDGTNGTPDMTDKFAYGTATQAEINTTGGTPDSVSVAHTHQYTHAHASALTAAGAHSHLFELSNNDFGQTDVRIGGVQNPGGTIPTDVAPDHTHTSTVDTSVGTSSNAGVSGVGRNIPPYIKLAYIQRMT